MAGAAHCPLATPEAKNATSETEKPLGQSHDYKTQTNVCQTEPLVVFLRIFTCVAKIRP
jgi:hypothetical protein